MRKKLIITGSILVVLLVVLLGFIIFSRNSDSPLAETIRDTLPFGKGDENINTPRDNFLDNIQATTTPSTVQIGTPGVGLFRIAAEPVAGYIALALGSTTIVRYADRATGHMYDVNPTTLVKTKITNTTLPKVYEAHFRSDGTKVLYRTLRGENDIIDNLSLSLTPPAATSSRPSQEIFHTFTSTLLRGDIDEVSVGRGDTLFYVLKDSPSIVSSTFEGTNLKTLLATPFTEWRLSPFSTNLVVWTKASSNVPGYAYVLNSSGNLSKILGPLNGLTLTAHPSGERIIYSYNQSDGIKLFVKDLPGGEAVEIFPPTLSEKCIWSKVATTLIYCGVPGTIGRAEPDNWYKGITHFSDSIWVFDTNTTEGLLMAEPKKELDVNLDTYSLQLSPREDYLFFINRNDLSLWALRLEE